ncbi:PEP-CTERM sorting domain-containing protein [Kiritimatiellaeota bacterium B1221]|nr:PEP-CTERM sorting domain-containing protein [Kiritimatiellaeota bacterium B1221]
MQIPNFCTRHFTAFLSLCCLLAMASTSAVLVPVSAVTHTDGELNTVTINGVTTGTLYSATGFIQNANSGGYIGAGSAPTDIDGALNGLDMSTGTLNTDFEAQFGAQLSDSIQVILMGNQGTSDQNYWGTSITIYALDATGTRLDSANLDLKQFNASTHGGTNPSTPLYSETYQRSTSGTLNRTVYGASFTLTDLELDGLNATGIEILTTGVGSTGYTLDTQLIGLAVIPEPASLALLLGGMIALLATGKRRT